MQLGDVLNSTSYPRRRIQIDTETALVSSPLVISFIIFAKMSNQTASAPILDHLVVLVSHATLLKLPDQLKDVLVIAPGGTHADGATANKLILFEDGFYIELIAFVEGKDPNLRKKHRWGQQKENTIIDWAYTLPDERDFEAVRERVGQTGTGITYAEPTSGGRTREDGTELKWAVAISRDELNNALTPGYLPFWCLDRTSRSLRVPYENNPQHTRHPSGVRGVSTISVTVPTKEVKNLGQAYNAVHNASNSTDGWHFSVPSGTTKAKHTIALSGSNEEASISLTFLGSPTSPPTLELLPGLILNIEQ